MVNKKKLHESTKFFFPKKTQLFKYKYLLKNKNIVQTFLARFRPLRHLYTFETRLDHLPFNRRTIN